MNTNMKFAVTGQRIELTEPVMLVAGTVHIYTASFAFDAAWDGYTKTAVFSGYGVEREQLLTDDVCKVPWEVLTPGKYLRVGVYGTKDDIRLPTIWTERTQYINSGAGPTDEAAEPSPTLVEQLTAKVGNLDALKTEDKSSVVAAINEVWASGGGGTGGGTTDHSKLTNRGAADQHPMSSITGLADALAGKQPTGNYLTEESDPTVPKWAKQPNKPTYTAQEVGALPATTSIPSTASDVNAEPSGAVAQHNVSGAAHSDIRALISGLTDRLNALADSDDATLDQLSEIVAYIKSNRNLISSITTSKVNVADIVNDLVTNVANKPLSAAQGVALKALIDAITIPTALPNPNALTLTGAVSATYDGSAPVSVEIPSGGGSGENWRLVNTVTTTEDVKEITITKDSNGNPISLRRAKVVGRVRGNSSSLTNWIRNSVNKYVVPYIYCDWPNGFAAKDGQDNYCTNRSDFSVCGNALFVEMNLSSLNNAASKDTLYYSNKKLSNSAFLAGVESITSIEVFSSGAAIGAGTEIYVYGVDA